MKNPLGRRFPLALCLLATATTVHSDEARVDRLEERLDSLQQDLRSATQQRVRFNGFMTTGVARASNNAGYAGVTESSEAQSLTLFGLQGRFEISDATSATIQLVARGEDDGRNDFETELEWGYLSHRLDNGLRVRAGQMRVPVFMYSDSLELGYSQPWARSPSVVYDQVRLSNYTGADAAYSYRLGNGSMRTQVFAGHSRDELEAGGSLTEIELRNLGGGVISWSDYTWTFRGVAARADTSYGFLDAALGEDEYDGEFYGLGAEFKGGGLFVVSEVTRREVEGVFSDTDSAYITGGYRFGSVSPYATVAWIESQDDKEREGTPFVVLNEQREDYSFGVRYDLTPGVALKADWTHSRAFGDTDGGLDNNTAPGGGARFDHTNVYTVTIDAAF